jgi:peptidyl-tRNA hydrolase
MKHFKPADNFARTNKQIQIFSFAKFKRNCLSTRGTFQFQNTNHSGSVLKIRVGSGRYIGDGQTVTAFVMNEINSSDQVLINNILKGVKNEI